MCGMRDMNKRERAQLVRRLAKVRELNDKEIYELLRGAIDEGRSNWDGYYDGYHAKGHSVLEVLKRNTA